MTELIAYLVGGDLRSDGRANEAADRVLEQPARFLELVTMLGVPEPLIKGRAAHALERVSRRRPEWFERVLPDLAERASSDDTAMVRWHLAMVLGNVVDSDEQAEMAVPHLTELLADSNAIVRSWAISSLALIARRCAAHRTPVLSQLAPLVEDPKAAVRKRAGTAIDLIRDPGAALPARWSHAEKGSETADEPEHRAASRVE